MNLRLCLVPAFLLAAAPVAAQNAPRLLDTLPIPVQTQEVFGQRIAYYEAGTGPTLLLLPHLGWDSHMWAQNLPELARHFHVVAVDPLGTGRSDKPMIEYKMDTWTDVLAEFMRARGIRRATVGGVGMGGALSVQMALDYPDLVDGIVVVASSSGPGPRTGGANSPPFGPSLSGVRASLMEAFHDSTLVTDELVRARFEFRLRAGDGYTIQRHLADHRAPYTEAELARIGVPALFVWCREDRTTPLSWGESFAGALPGGTLAVLEKCGHLPNLEQPAAFNRSVIDFLRGARRTS